MLAVCQTAGMRDADGKGWAGSVDESDKFSWGVRWSGKASGKRESLRWDLKGDQEFCELTVKGQKLLYAKAGYA